MKAIRYYILASLLLILAGSCSKEFLEREPLDSLTMDTYYQSYDELRAAVAPLYSTSWFEYNDKGSFSFGDCLGGNMINPWSYEDFVYFTYTSLDQTIGSGWASLYRVVGHANLHIRNIQERSAESIEESLKMQVIGEARFMRAVAYFYLVRLWGDVPIIEDNIALSEDYIVPLNRAEDVYQYVINDLMYAIENLPESDPEPGRVTSWSAKAMLAKVYLTYSGYGASGGMRNQDRLDSAQYYAGDVVQNGPYALMEDYADLFRIENDNNIESVFAWQWIAGNYGDGNSFQAYFAGSGTITGVGDGWGGAVTATNDLAGIFDYTDNIRRKATFMMPNDNYPELNAADGGYTHEGSGANFKKYIVGTPDDNNGEVRFMSAANNTYILRYAEVLLIYAESILGNNSQTNDAEALAAFNQVRSRAGVSEFSTLTFRNIFDEKRREMALEGNTWFEIVAWWYFDPDAALEYIAGQDRGRYIPGDASQTTHEYYSPPGSKMQLPYPESEVAQNPLFNEPPVPYDFGE
ncbi:MAG: RagB/SusD family nutrient uptake outer membrane protein [Bacteroidales bacterium]|nr:RagB/SusD family nutrient uptake outer membrane protein [Bacteroidales bacterium]